MKTLSQLYIEKTDKQISQILYPEKPYNMHTILPYHSHKEGRKEGNVLFNDALNTFYLRLYGVGHMVKDH